jgi:hypothetical protein
LYERMDIAVSCILSLAIWRNISLAPLRNGGLTHHDIPKQTYGR